ncbi:MULTISPECIES: hypothetical protein [unclassified Pseudomonas]|uniref:hypothetical protein n=1 Tax=unclassified Pseudomonas TaxID=196821 RepID=UPI002AC89DE3|nr:MULTISPECIES: hypothetical protein [unclassified Pseudomonas]MEB0043277.1 hypothetical protein [Pseudomonas sp. MH10]MEB0075795.1 hypothetical protein [Pseudomonas sp. MH10out]MEB0091736.1 hypothetical protein [Pseudomonas sp. CCI4.2]MEB0099728.1 hypothetical protein [Pseudomonas sp. CCI3.2]MEB0131549.1 hypothetical protein [Pseudomonas sp. CCI2.4]
MPHLVIASGDRRWLDKNLPGRLLLGAPLALIALDRVAFQTCVGAMLKHDGCG